MRNLSKIIIISTFKSKQIENFIAKVLYHIRIKQVFGRLANTFKQHKHTCLFITLILSLLCIATLPRIWELNSPSFTYDELGDFMDSLRFRDTKSLESWLRPISDGYLNGQLPYYISRLLHQFVAPGPEISARILSVFAGIMDVILLFILLTKMFGIIWGFWGACFLALSSFHISASRLAFSHGHILFTPIILLITILLFEGIENKKKLKICVCLAGFLSGVAVGTDLLSTFFLLSCVVYIFFSFKTMLNRGKYLLFYLVNIPCGVAVSSPMYLLHPLKAAHSILQKISRWDSLENYLWLGNEIKDIPAVYYIVILLVKIVPVLMLLFLLSPIYLQKLPVKLQRFKIFICLSLWPIIYMSFKNWKSPYYVTWMLPFIFILAVISLKSLRFQSIKLTLWVKAILIIFILGHQTYNIIIFHPDYLMLGVQYSEKLYGEFQGPAVSHGQWIGEALKFIKSDSNKRDPLIIAVNNVVQPQLHYYSRRFGLRKTINMNNFKKREKDTSSADYSLINVDARRLTSPLHQTAIEENLDLLKLLEQEPEYKMVKNFSTAGFSIVEIYKKADLHKK